MRDEKLYSKPMAGEAIFISDKEDFKPKFLRGKDYHFILTKGTMQQGVRTIEDIYVPNFIKIILIWNDNIKKQKQANKKLYMRLYKNIFL